MQASRFRFVHTPIYEYTNAKIYLWHIIEALQEESIHFNRADNFILENNNRAAEA